MSTNKYPQTEEVKKQLISKLEKEVKVLHSSFIGQEADNIPGRLVTLEAKGTRIMLRYYYFNTDDPGWDIWEEPIEAINIEHITDFRNFLNSINLESLHVLYGEANKKES